MPSSSLNNCRPGKTTQKTASIYLHIPFCRTKCLYCSFNSYAGRDNEIPAYLEALGIQIKNMATHPWCRGRLFTSLYIGGGTPSLCDPGQLADLIRNCRKHFHFCRQPEISLETNPNTLSPQKLTTFFQAGINRLSIGVQSFSDEVLAAIGRSHTADNAVKAYHMARETGFDNINLDLMYGLPGQSPTIWQQTLEQVVALSPEHISLYELMQEEGTPLTKKISRGECVLPTEDDIVEMEELTGSFLDSNGYRRYEISNYAKPGFTCRHNINYWQNRSWLGLGAGAVGSLSGVRITNVAEPGDYTCLIKKERVPYSEIECLCREARFRETVIMGLRILSGISVSELHDRFNLTPCEYYGDTFSGLVSRRLLIMEGDYLRLSQEALPVANQVLARLV
ncbi:MAG: radical SAM family heme chaperone HemW [Desulfobulbaceae bacterium]|nr:radical SAM family heme chaperone HemW [Desulfobulbaceae bacterium]